MLHQEPSLFPILSCLVLGGGGRANGRACMKQLNFSIIFKISNGAVRFAMLFHCVSALSPGRRGGLDAASHEPKEGEIPLLSKAKKTGRRSPCRFRTSLASSVTGGEAGSRLDENFVNSFGRTR